MNSHYESKANTLFNRTICYLIFKIWLNFPSAKIWIIWWLNLKAEHFMYRNFILAFLFNLKFFEMSILYCFSFIVFCLTFYHNWRHLETESGILRLNVWIPEESFLTDIYLFCPLYNDTEWKCKLKRVFDWHIFHIV